MSDDDLGQLPVTLKLYTIQLAKWRKAQAMGMPLVDTTVKSGLSAFAPTWDMLRDLKEGIITQEQYTELYLKKMQMSQTTVPVLWDRLVNMGTVSIACYCRAGKFCHRHVLKDILDRYCAQHGIHFEYMGEIE